MQQSFIDILLTDAAVKAVCWTLVHSIWQGLLAAFFAGAVILTTRKSAAALRYNLLTADLVIFLAAAVATFSYELRQGGAIAGAEPAGTVVVNGSQVTAGKATIHFRYDASTTSSMLERTGIFLNEHAAMVVMVWMVCLLVQLLKMTGGLYRIQRLRRQRIFVPSGFWMDRMGVLMERLGIDKKVVLLQSGSVTMPVTFGFLKPAILVPLGMLANLPADQVDTILLHELAHIRRSDYLANLLLYFVEAIFFFNPGIRWLGWLIRQEREACCDDLVLAGTRDKNSYLEALVAFGELATGRTPMALALGGRRSDLLWRIRRMLNQENKKLHLMEKTILSVALMAVLAIGLVSMKGGEKLAAAGRPVTVRVSAGAAATKPVLDTVPATSGKKPVSAVKASAAMADTAGASAITVDSMSASVTSIGPNGITIRVTGKHLSPQVAAKMAAAAMKVAATGETVVTSSTTATIAPVTKISVTDARTTAPVTAIATPKAAVGNSVVMSATNYTERTGPAAATATPVAVTAPAAPAAAPSTSINTYIDPIIADLKARGLIQSEDPLSFRLNVHGLWVNGVQQPAEVYQAFKEKYFTNSRNSFYYSLQGGSVVSSVGLTNE